MNFTPVDVPGIRFVLEGKGKSQARVKEIIAEKHAEKSYFKRVLELVAEKQALMAEKRALKREIRRLKRQGRG